MSDKQQRFETWGLLGWMDVWKWISPWIPLFCPVPGQEQRSAQAYFKCHVQANVQNVFNFFTLYTTWTKHCFFFYKWMSVSFRHIMLTEYIATTYLFVYQWTNVASHRMCHNVWRKQRAGYSQAKHEQGHMTSNSPAHPTSSNTPVPLIRNVHRTRSDMFELSAYTNRILVFVF